MLASAGHSTAPDRFINIFQAWQIMDTPEVSQSPPGTSQILIDQIETWLSASRQEAPLPVPLSTADLLASIVVSPNPTTTGNAPPTG